MQLSRRLFMGAAIAATAGVSTGRAFAEPMSAPIEPAVAFAEPRQAYRPPLLEEALAALDTHSGYILDRSRIGLVDFAAPSSEPRFHLVDVASGQIMLSWLVAHGNGSDPTATGMLQYFSNVPGSNASSRGSYVTSTTYYGKHGRSQRLIGLDESNNMAWDRAIVLHGASYVDPSMISARGRIGRSQGCFAVEQREIATVMEQLGAGRLLYAGRPGDMGMA
ncbi:MAG: murein L,D-transpeptidase catalytic domain family protein [Porphyrobacter sp.]|nr:murein L,D-transpeptidase catalytic domain family protein [Porphyrobacter sp.]